TLLVKNFQSKTVFSSSQNFSDNFEFYVNLLLPLNYSLDLIVFSEYGVVNKTIELKGREFLFKPKIVKEKFNYNLGEKAKFEINFEKRVDRKNVKVYLIDPEGSEKEVEFYEKDGKYFVDLDFGRSFRPGLYKLKVKTIEEKFVEKGRAPFKVSEKVVEVLEEEETEFGVGLVVVNTPKSIYLPGEEVKIIVGVLNEEGKRAYDAVINLVVTSPSGKIKVYNSYNGDFANDELDGSLFVIYNQTDEIGNYSIKVIATGQNLNTTYESFFEVRNFAEFEIERKMKTLIDIGHPNLAEIKIKARVDVENITIIEKLPNDFLEIVVYNGRIEKKENETWLIWNLNKLNESEEKVLRYTFTTPDVKPAIYLAGPIYVLYNNSYEFKEIKPWTFIIVDVVYYFFKFLPYYKTDPLQYAVDAVHHLVYNSFEIYRDAVVMCRNNMNYTLRLVLTDEADDDAGILQDWELQVATPTWQPITSSGTNGWKLFPGETNPHTSQSGIGTGDTCTRNPTTANGDKCEWDGYLVWNITITPSAPLGLNKIRVLPKTRTTGPMFETNILYVYLIDCEYPYDINLIRPIKIFSPTGEPTDKILRGHLAKIVIPLANYNTSFDKSADVSIKILDTRSNQEVDWFVVEGKTKRVNIPRTLNAPNWNTSIVTFTVLIPDNIEAVKYKVVVNISLESSFVTHEKTFDVYTDDSESSTDIVLFSSTPRMLGANCESSDGTTCDNNIDHSADCAGTNYCFRDIRVIYVCNYGDYNLTVNITDQTTGLLRYFSTESTPAVPQPNVNESGGTVLRWYNVNLNTSSCFRAEIPYRPSDDIGEETFYLTVEWKDPSTGEIRSVTQKHVSLTSANTGTKNPTISSKLNVTTALPGQNLPLRIIPKLGGTDYATTVESTRGALIHYVEIFIPPGFSKPTNFRIVDLNGGASVIADPEPGYPLGSEEEGWIVKFSPYRMIGIRGTTGTVMRVGVATSPQGVSEANYIEFTTNVVSTDKVVPGGKVLLTNYIGWGRINKAYIFHLDRSVLTIQAPFLKTVRYYNTTPTDEQLNFPLSFACGNFSTKLQVFNKGNLPAYNFRINETKSDILKTHPGDLIFYDFNPSNPYLEQSKLISWDGEINFITTGKDNAKNFTYSIFVPYQTNGTFSFQSLAL
ncbi:MAG: hypothetical protein QXL14_03610, partial [Candidatus Aenigmatarchaeota archaeon]